MEKENEVPTNECMEVGTVQIPKYVASILKRCFVKRLERPSPLSDEDVL